jgi:hypothetical protein
MTFEEKRKLSAHMASIPGEKLSAVLDIIAECEVSRITGHLGLLCTTCPGSAVQHTHFSSFRQPFSLSMVFEGFSRDCITGAGCMTEAAGGSSCTMKWHETC